MVGLWGIDYKTKMPKKTLKDLVNDRFGVVTDFRVNPLDIANIGAATVKILPNNPNRVAWVFVNLSANVIYLLNDETVGITNGVRLVANGGIASMVWDTDFDITGFGLWAMASGAGSNFMVFEIIII